MEKQEEIKKKKKTLHAFGIASFLNDFGSDMIFPIWPVFITSVLGANMAMLGFIDGMGDALVAISQMFSGYLADKTGKRKVFVWLGYCFAGLARLGYALSHTWQMAIPFRAIDRFGKMRGAPRDAIVADISDDTNRARNFGYLRMMDNAGAVAGVLFTLAFFNYLGYRNLFLVAAIPSLIGAMMIWKVVREEKTERKIFKGFNFRHLSRDMRLYLISSALFSLASFSYSFLLLAAHANGYKVATLPMFYLIFSVVAALTSLYFGKLADRIGRKPVLLFAYFLWAAMCLILSSTSNLFAVVAAFVIYGLHQGSSEPIEKTIASELADPELRASTLGTYQFVIGIMALPASLIAGLAWDYTGNLNASLFISAGLTLCSAILLLMVRESKA